MRRTTAVTIGFGLVGAAAAFAIVSGRQRTAYLEEVDAARAAAERLGVATKVHAVLPGERDIADSLAHSFSIPEEHDGQMLTSACRWNWTCDDYDSGPVYARVDETNVQMTLDQFARKVVVARITVPGGSRLKDFGFDGGTDLGETVPHYLLLKAQRPDNAVDPGFDAWIQREGTEVKKLVVHFTPRPDNVVRDIPPALAFFWYPRGAWLEDVPLIGIKCPGGWCFIGNERGEPNWSADGDKKKRCTSKDETTDCVDVYGFHDEQRLAVSAGANGEKKRGDSWGLVLPVRDLESMADGAFNSAPVPVATIRIWGKAYVKTSLTLPTKAQLRLSLQHSGSDLATGWTANVDAKYDASNTWTPLQTGLAVERTAHGERVIGAARWEWDPDDEGVWVRCGAGCCKIPLS
jgi:hypothetical protein